MPLNEYTLERAIDVIRGQVHVQIGAGRYQTSDPQVIAILRGYPGVHFDNSVTTPPVARDPEQVIDETLAPFIPPRPEVEVRTHCGLQIREKEPSRGPRIAER